MKDKYIIYFISRTKANMIKFIENKLKENATKVTPTINFNHFFININPLLFTI